MKRSLQKNIFTMPLVVTSTLVMIVTLLGIFSGCSHSVKQTTAYMKEPPLQIEEMAVHFDEQDNLIRPEGYREWIYIGSPLTPNDMNKGKAPFPEFHAVYVQQQNFTEFKKIGKFPDGTILVKELISVGSKKAASGHGYFMGEFIGLEASLKDSKRYPNEPGNWAYFSFTTEHGKPFKEKVKALPTSACNACHQSFAEEDWVFTQYYPVLQAAKPK